MTGRCPSAGSRHLVGDPVDVVTGANMFREGDIEIAEPFELIFYRHYDSRWCRDNRGLGPGFRHGLDHWLVFDLDGITYREADGTDRHFPHLVHDGQRVASGGCWLERVDEERYVVTQHARPTKVFRRPPGDREAELAELRQVVDGVEQRVPLAYDSRGRLSQILVAHDETLRLEWDEQGYLHGVRRLSEGDKREWLIRYHYEHGYLVAATDMYGHTFRLEYDQLGRVRRRVDRRGFGFQFEYDEAGRCVSSVGDDGTLGVSITYKPVEYETRVLDANAAEWVYQYDASGAVVLITDPYGGVRYFKTGDDGRVLREYDANGGCTTYLHDEAGAPVAKIDPQGHVTKLPESFPPKMPGAHRVPKLPIEWELGDLWERDFQLPDPHELPYELPAEVRDALTTSDSPLRGTVRTVRDFQGHRVREEVESGAARVYGYNANGGLETVVDMQGGAWRIDVDGFNDIVAETDPLGGTLRYRFSQTRAMVAALDQAGTETEYDRDLKDRITGVRRDGELRETYAWDPADHLIMKRDALGEVMLEIERDNAGRPVVKKLASGEQHELVYDDDGRLVEARTSRGRCTFAYDWAGRRTEDKRDGKGVEHRFALDRLRSTTVLGRFRTEYQAAAGGGVVITDPTGRQHGIRSHGRGLFTRDFANGFSETVQYHPRAGRVLAKVLFRRDTQGHAWARRYQYSDEGELRLVIDSDAGPSRYEYDAAHRLTKATQPHGGEAAFRYNAAGTLFESSTLQGGTVGKQNQLRQANGERYAYDHRGHLRERVSSRGKIGYDYDSLDQLSVVFWEGPNGERWGWDADYDPLGRRTRKAPGYTQETHFYWDTDRLAAEVFPDGRLRVYVYPDAFSVVPLLFVDYESEDADPSSGRVYYCFTDQRGAMQRVLDDDGAVVWSARLEPYGYAHVEQGAEFHQPLRFPGHYYDAETGLHQNRFRYYDPVLGRYLQPDPIGLRGGPNLYAYTRSPLTQVDLRGLSHDQSGERSDDQAETPPQHVSEAQAGTHHPRESTASSGDLDGHVRSRMAQLEQEGHGPQRHEGGVTAQQLHDRAIGVVDPNTGQGSGPIDPMTGSTQDGVHGGTHRCGRHATRVTSESAYVQAEDHLRGSEEFREAAAAADAAGDDRFQVEAPLEDIYGESYPQHVEGVTRGGSKQFPTGNPPGSSPPRATDFSGGTMLGRYRRGEDGEWKTTTMFPQPK